MNKEPARNGDEHEFDVEARHVIVIAESLLTKHFGERCADYCEGCLCCERWLALDVLTKNPYIDTQQADASPRIEGMGPNARRCLEVLRAYSADEEPRHPNAE